MEDDRICKLAGLDENRAKWRKVRARALHGFVQCSDGRLYHPIIAAQALIAWEKRAEHLAEKENEADRQRRVRADRKRIFEQLRAAGVTPKWDIPMRDLRELVALHVTPPVTVTGSQHVTPPVTVTDTAKTGRDGTGIEKTGPDTHTADSTAEERDHEPPAEFSPTQAGLICRAMRQAGIADTNPGHPDLLALIAAGATGDEFTGAARAAIDKGKGFLYALGTLKGQRIEAAKATKAMHQGAMPTTSTNDRKARQLATAGLMTGATRPAPPAPPTEEVFDVAARFIAP